MVMLTQFSHSGPRLLDRYECAFDLVGQISQRLHDPLSLSHSVQWLQVNPHNATRWQTEPHR